MKGTALAAITRDLSFEVGAKTANDPPCLKIPVPTGVGIHLSDFEPVVETAHGKVLGYSHNGVYGFKAVRYGADTSGTNRFTPLQKPAPWPGVRSCLCHGFVCPQPQRAGWNNEEFWVFSPGRRHHKRRLPESQCRPGMVWAACKRLHGWLAASDLR
jgi:hypothetical protein